jgi:uncharacterized protein (DUF488 family)
MDLYTIGHSNHPIDKFTQLLVDHNITRLVDVRSTPYSRYNPQFNQGSLKQTVLELEIEYYYLGRELGGRPADPSCYRNQAIPNKASDYLKEVDYTEVMKRPWFIQGIQRLLVLSDEQPTCILCSEKDPLRCHRHHLITSYLVDHFPDVKISHILADGSEIEATSLLSMPGDRRTGQLSF